MNTLITDMSKLTNKIADPIKFLNEVGIDKETGKQAIADIKELLANNPSYLAVAAPQLGYNLRIFGIKFDDAIKIFVNPIITKKTGQQIFPETCLSLPGKEYLLGRPQELDIVYYTEEYTYENNKFLDVAARIVDQMINILDGIYPNLLGMESDIQEDGCWANASDEDLEAAQNFYMTEWVPRLNKAMKDGIQQDKTLAEQLKMYSLTEDVINGRTQIVSNEDTKAVSQMNKLNARYNKQKKDANFKKKVERCTKK